LQKSKSRRYFAKTKHSDINFIKASALELPLKSKTYDSVIAASLLNIIPDKNLLLNEMFRTCKQGGKVSVLVPSDNFSDQDLTRLQKEESTFGFSSAAMKAWHNKPPKMSIKEISDLFENSGFTDIKSKYYIQGMVISVTAIKPLISNR